MLIFLYSVFTHVASIYTNLLEKKAFAYEKSTTPRRLVWDTNAAAVSLFWDTSMAAMTSCENTLYAAVAVEIVNGKYVIHGGLEYDNFIFFFIDLFLR